MLTYRAGKDVDLEALAALREVCEFGAQPRATLAQQIDGARWVVSAWDGALLVGFARAISDGITNAYVSSVMVHRDYRRRGIATSMLARLMEGGGGIRWVLHARADAMAFYRTLAFTDAPDMMWRERTKRSP